MLYVKSSPKLRKKLFDITRDEKIKIVSKHTGFEEANIRRWRIGRRSTPIKMCQYIANTLNLDLWKLLENEKLKSETHYNTFKINHIPTIEECNFLGWILAEGHMSKNNSYKSIIIPQKHKHILNIIKIRTNKAYELKNNIKIKKDRNSWILIINLNGLKYYLNIRYRIPSGKKSRIIKIPKILFKLPKEQKLSFIAGCLEGDGTFSYYVRKTKLGTYKVPRIALSTYSKKFANDFKNLLVSLDYGPKIYANKNKDELKVSLLKRKDCEKLFIEIRKYMIYESKKKKFIDIITDKKRVMSLVS